MDPGGRGFRLGREVETVIEATERIEEARPRRFRRYPAYKDSGIEWLGEIPAHWESKALKRSFGVVNGCCTPQSGEPGNCTTATSHGSAQMTLAR